MYTFDKITTGFRIHVIVSQQGVTNPSMLEADDLPPPILTIGNCFAWRWRRITVQRPYLAKGMPHALKQLPSQHFRKPRSRLTLSVVVGQSPHFMTSVPPPRDVRYSTAPGRPGTVPSVPKRTTPITVG